MKKLYARCALLGAIITFAFATNLQAQTQTVSSNIDGTPFSLRLVIAAASAGDTIVFAPATNTGPHALLTGEILIDKDLVIIGNDTTNTLITATAGSRIFNVVGAGSLEIKGIKLPHCNFEVS